MLITLDSHTKKFFDDTYHRAPAQEFVHLATAGFEGRVFGIRAATCPNGQKVFIFQERGAAGAATGTGPIFLMEHYIFLGTNYMLIESALGFISSCPLKPKGQPQRCPETSLRIMEGGVWRYHFDRDSGWGCRVNLHGMCYLRDLRVRRDEEESFYSPSGLNWKQFRAPLAAQRTHSLLDMTPTTFHAKLRKEIRSEGTPLHRTLSLYRKSEEEQCQTMLRCSVGARQRAHRRVRAYLSPEIVEGGALYGESHWAWQMWNSNNFLILVGSIPRSLLRLDSCCGETE